MTAPVCVIVCRSVRFDQQRGRSLRFKTSMSLCSFFSSVKHIDSEVVEKGKEDSEKQPFGNAHSVFLNFVNTLCFEKTLVRICSGQQGINAVNQYECVSYTLPFVQN